MFILIQHNPHRILKKARSIEQLEYWAELLCPRRDFIITGTEGRDLSIYSQEQLTAMLVDRTPRGTQYSDVLNSVRAAVEELEPDETELAQLRKKLGRLLPSDKSTAKPNQSPRSTEMTTTTETTTAKKPAAKKAVTKRAAPATKKPATKKPAVAKKTAAPKVPGYKGHRHGSRKGTVHEVFDTKGAKAAETKGLALGLAQTTLKSWFGTWGKKA